MHSLGIVQWNSTRQDHPGNPGGVSGSGPVTFRPFYKKKNYIEHFIPYTVKPEKNSIFLKKGKTVISVENRKIL